MCDRAPFPPPAQGQTLRGKVRFALSDHVLGGIVTTPSSILARLAHERDLPECKKTFSIAAERHEETIKAEPQPFATPDPKTYGFCLKELLFTPTFSPRLRRATHQHRRSQVRILMYSHDTFGLGHLRRCRTIAHALVEAFKGVHVLIISGSQIAGAFDFKARVDFVKIPSVIKLYNGEYTSIGRHINIEETIEWRTKIIRSTAESFEPDILIVDKEPLGLKRELLPTLRYLKGRGCRLVVGLRDVLDDDELLAAEWGRNDTLRHIDRFYDDIWIYGPEGFWNPLQGLPLPQGLDRRFTYTGFLRREMPARVQPRDASLPERYLLVTAGGGGDGAPLMRAAIRARAVAPEKHLPFVILLGPFMSAEERSEIRALAAPDPAIHLVDFVNQPEALIDRAAAIVGMAGYNTFCEILSFDKPAMLVPRVLPRREQLIRAVRAAELGLVDALPPDEADDPAAMSARLLALPGRARPLEAGAASMLGGLQRIREEVMHFDTTAAQLDVFLPPAAE
jgi:predicted glycosyltransferase